LAPDGSGYLVVMGTNLLITGQAVGNIAMVTGLIPVIGVPLPFISYGGTSLLVDLCLVGLVLNVTKPRKEKPPGKPRLYLVPDKRRAR
jgi:cell division protein FtsW